MNTDVSVNINGSAFTFPECTKILFCNPTEMSVNECQVAKRIYRSLRENDVATGRNWLIIRVVNAIFRHFAIEFYWFFFRTNSLEKLKASIIPLVGQSCQINSVVLKKILTAAKTIQTGSQEVVVDDQTFILHKDENEKVPHIYHWSNKTELGKGGEGTVYKVRNVTTGIFQALKCAHVAKADALKLEYDNLVRLVPPAERSRHKYIAYTDTTKVNRSIMVAPVYEGILDPVVFLGSPDKALACCKQLIYQVYTCAHAGYVHLDIKRENIFVEKAENDTYKFLLRDLGGARPVGYAITNGLGFSWYTSVCRHINDMHHRRQVIGVTKGLLSSFVSVWRYIRGEPSMGQATPAINAQNESFVLSQDVFSLGLVLYQVLKGKGDTPFSDRYEKLLGGDYVKGQSSAYSLLRQVVDPTTRRPVYSDELCRLVEDMLNPDYTKRPNMLQVTARFNEIMRCASFPNGKLHM